MTPPTRGRSPLARLRDVASRWRRRSWRAAAAVRRAVPGRALGAIDVVRTLEPGVLLVQGWAICPGGRVVAVVVFLDDRSVLAQLGVPRPDVVEVFGKRAGGEGVGWEVMIDVPTGIDREIPVTALVVSDRGLVESLGTRPAPKSEPALLGDLDPPRETEAHGVVNIEGWAMPAERLARVEISVDGRSAGLARPLAASRVESALSSAPGAPLAGFVHTVPIPMHEAGDRLRITGEIITCRGRRTPLGPVETVVAEGAPAVHTHELEWLEARVAEACARTAGTSAPEVRLLVVTHRLDLGGGQLYLSELLQRLLVESDTSCLVVAAHDGPLRDELEALGATVHVRGEFPARSPDHYEITLCELAELARAHGCNVAIVNTMGAGIGADLALRLGIPAVWAIHESYELAEYWFAAYGPGGIDAYVKDRMTAALRGVAALVFEAEATRRAYLAHGDARRLITVPYGIAIAEVDTYRESANVDQLRRDAGIPTEAKVLLCMGTVEPRKAQAALVASFAEVLDDFPEALLVLVGDTGSPYAEGVHELVRRYELGEQVRVLPVVEDVYRWYALSDVLVSASDVESLPRSALEAMAFRLPVLAASVFGLPELIEDGVTGMLYAPRDLDALVGALRRVLSASPEELEKQVDAAEDLVRSRYDAAGYAAVYRKLVRKLVDDPDGLPTELLSG